MNTKKKLLYVITSKHRPILGFFSIKATKRRLLSFFFVCLFQYILKEFCINTRFVNVYYFLKTVLIEIMLSFSFNFTNFLNKYKKLRAHLKMFIIEQLKYFVVKSFFKLKNP